MCEVRENALSKAGLTIAGGYCGIDRATCQAHHPPSTGTGTSDGRDRASSREFTSIAVAEEGRQTWANEATSPGIGLSGTKAVGIDAVFSSLAHSSFLPAGIRYLPLSK
jgi:hypothetical protein